MGHNNNSEMVLYIGTIIYIYESKRKNKKLVFKYEREYENITHHNLNYKLILVKP